VTSQGLMVKVSPVGKVACFRTAPELRRHMNHQVRHSLVRRRLCRRGAAGAHAGVRAAGSFIPRAEVEAARDMVRYRTKIVQQRVIEIARLGNTLQDAGIKTGLGGLLGRHQVRAR
jgi:hypothetical protein